MGLLLQRGAAINAKDEDGQTPLQYAELCEQVMAAGVPYSPVVSKRHWVCSVMLMPLTEVSKTHAAAYRGNTW